MSRIENDFEIFEDYVEIIVNSPKYGKIRTKIDLKDFDIITSRHWYAQHDKKGKHFYIKHYDKVTK